MKYNPYNVKLKDITIKIGSGATPRGGKEAYKEQGISLIRSQNVIDFKFSTDGLAHIDEEQAKLLDNVEVLKNDILLNITGDSVARCCMAPEKLLPARVNQHVSIIRAKTGILNPHYLMYYLLNEPVKKYLLSLAGNGATRQALTKGMIENIELKLPEKEYQDKAASILLSLDRKIALNNQINKALEDMAQAIFKRWFIDFEFLDENGQPYKSSGGDMVDSEMGPIPKGWKVKVISDISNEIICGKTPPTSNKEYYGGDIPFITIPDMHNKVFITSTERYLSDVGAKSQNNKTLPPFSICVSCIATPGLVIMTTSPSQTNQQINSVICNNSMSHYYLYYYFINISDKIKNLGMGGSATLNLNKTQFSKIKVLVPSDITLWEYHNKVTSNFNAILLLQRQTETLVKIRDSLLPKLMSGEIKVPIEDEVS